MAYIWVLAMKSCFNHRQIYILSIADHNELASQEWFEFWVCKRVSNILTVSYNWEIDFGSWIGSHKIYTLSFVSLVEFCHLYLTRVGILFPWWYFSFINLILLISASIRVSLPLPNSYTTILKERFNLDYLQYKTLFIN